MKSLLIVKTGATLEQIRRRHGDFDDWLRKGLAQPDLPCRVRRPRAGETLPPPPTVAGAVVTGSHDMVTDRPPWSTRTGRWLTRAASAGVPVLGVCYGHQLLALAAGGTVGDNPRGPEFGTVTVRLTDAAAADPLFSGLPPAFPAHVGHSQSVLRLPAGATLLATGSGDGHQAFRLGPCAWGVQFHPEFDTGIAGAYAREFSDLLAAAGHDPRRVLEGIAPTPEAAGLLRRFGSLAAARVSA